MCGNSFPSGGWRRGAAAEVWDAKQEGWQEEPSSRRTPRLGGNTFGYAGQNCGPTANARQEQLHSLIAHLQRRVGR